ncbi:MAG: LysM peptidoglycan-binding domain-containing protein [Anaerolineaceae bacterium]
MKTKSKTLPLFMLLLIVLVLSLSTLRLPASAQGTPYQTPTPNANGDIIFKVRPGDNCISISLLTNVSIETIKSLNGLDDTCTLYEDQEIVLGRVEPVVLTQTAMPTPTIPLEMITPSPTPSPGTATICVVLFHDMDGNGMRTIGEDYLYGGEVSISNRSGSVSLTGTTVAGNPDEVDPRCFPDLPQDSYNVTVAIPDGFNATTTTNYALEVKAGEDATIDFGAQESAPSAGVVEPDSARRSPVLAIIGGVILLAGLGLGYYLWRTRKI